MTVAEAQREVRVAYVGGFFGLLVSGTLWLASAAVATWGEPRPAILLLVLGGVFIFPLSWALLRLTGHRAALSPSNPMNELAMEVALVLPLCLPLVGAAVLHRLNWFYPSMMIVVGAHYLPFAFLYGMRMFLALAGLLVSAGFLIGVYAAGGFSLGGWVTGVVLFAFAAVGRQVVIAEQKGSAA